MLTYHIFSEWLSLIVKTRSYQAIRKLLDPEPDKAFAVKTDGTEKPVALESLQIGDRVRIRPGERVPVDGEVLSGVSDVNESFVTGEPIPVVKKPGDRTLSGSTNGH